MPRHTTAHAEAFLEARKPRVIFIEPEPCWVIDTYRVKRWYYRAAPAVGDKVMYLQDGFSTRVSDVKFWTIFFEDSGSMRRPYAGRRMLAWVLPRLQNRLPNRRPVSARRTSRLRPDAATILV